MTCRRCGTETPRLTLTQRRCPPCERDVAARLHPAPAPDRRPAWVRWVGEHRAGKDLTGGVVG